MSSWLPIRFGPVGWPAERMREVGVVFVVICLKTCCFGYAWWDEHYTTGGTAGDVRLVILKKPSFDDTPSCIFMDRQAN